MSGSHTVKMRTYWSGGFPPPSVEGSQTPCHPSLKRVFVVAEVSGYRQRIGQADLLALVSLYSLGRLLPDLQPACAGLGAIKGHTISDRCFAVVDAQTACIRINAVFAPFVEHHRCTLVLDTGCSRSRVDDSRARPD